ncbi:hypothetical protein PENSPDRAFT_653882 [Peniophora sp. CONT]|nr:hypothetical protein PENSPDRAFT_653882 [Peniophora sp. CONT]
MVYVSYIFWFERDHVVSPHSIGCISSLSRESSSRGRKPAGGRRKSEKCAPPTGSKLSHGCPREPKPRSPKRDCPQTPTPLNTISALSAERSFLLSTTMFDIEEDHEMQNPSFDPVQAEEDDDMEVSAPTKQARPVQGEEEGEEGDQEEDDGEHDEEDANEEDEGRPPDTQPAERYK